MNPGYRNCNSNSDEVSRVLNMTSISSISSPLYYPAAVMGNNSQKSDDPTANAAGTASKQLTTDEEQQVEKLKSIDRKVRAHEAAHEAAAGGLARSGASFTYATGPDGQRYAVGGEVQIDTSAVAGDPKATILKMQRVKQAALAPADPSAQDRSVAAEASEISAKASQELTTERSLYNKKSAQAYQKKIGSFAGGYSSIDRYA